MVTASVTFKADIHLANKRRFRREIATKLFTIIENKADFFIIKNKNIAFKNVKSNGELKTRNISYLLFC